MGKGFQLSSGRIIALGRLLLAILYLLAVWTDASQPARSPFAAYSLIGIYIGFAALLAGLTWNNWYRDAHLAGPAHAIDMAMFTALVMFTEGYTSPYFAFFMFVLLASAIRWNWHATALTAVLLTLLYLLAGQIARSSGIPFEAEHFTVRTGHLVILSLIVIWFGANQRFTLFDVGNRQRLAQPSLDESPLDAGLRAAMDVTHSGDALFIWRGNGEAEFAGVAIRDGAMSEVRVPPAAVTEVTSSTPFLYDSKRGRGLRRDDELNVAEVAQKTIVQLRAVRRNLTQGLAIPVHSDSGQGIVLLEKIRGLSTDHIAFGEQLATELAAKVQRHDLLRSAEESAEARSRLTLARDLHDSVVQFLAGAAFRLEALKRSVTAEEVEAGLNELKQLMLHEQRELRSFIAALRSGSLATFSDLADDLQTLATRLAMQWDIECECSAHNAELMIPTRLRLDAQQMVREAVANAVRHAAAKSVRIELGAVPDALTLDIINDGGAYKSRRGRLDLPTSLKERVEQVGGTLDMASGMGVTRLSISLPVEDNR